jgi:hypothetical protein
MSELLTRKEFLELPSYIRASMLISPSKLLLGYYYWNTTGDELRADFPTIYINRKELQGSDRVVNLTNDS